ncbi:MAG: hypothetical protein LPK15_06315 [Alteromonadaceae bacterium]|nr:hypothetical protein [Marinobacter sp.]MDX5385801.1 hypothetical protein [Marinobacter sp.]MDX5440046.1 hypothetical protein [Alteromonadaceae bacterium]
MTISPEKVWFGGDNLWVLLSDGRTVGAPLVWGISLTQSVRVWLSLSG